MQVGFDAIVAELEAVHGPYATWPIPVHQEHTNRINRALGRVVEHQHASDDVIPMRHDPGNPFANVRRVAVRR